MRFSVSFQAELLYNGFGGFFFVSDSESAANWMIFNTL